MYKYSIIIFIKNLNNLSCLSGYKIIFYNIYIYILIFKFSKLANVFPISKRENKKNSNFIQNPKNQKLKFFFLNIVEGLIDFFLNIVEGLIDSVCENHLLHRSG